MSRAELYDIETIEVMRRCLCPASVCIDAGAHEGAMLSKMQDLAPKAQHYAFEPIPLLAESLAKRFAEARVFDCALGNLDGESTFYLIRNAPAYSGLRMRTYDHPNPEIEKIRTRVRRLDDMFPTNLNVTFIKLDIEGGEYDALCGGTNTIKRCRPVIVFEAGSRSTAHYGVSPEKLYGLLTCTLGLNVSTMERWMNGLPPFSPAGFLDDYDIDWYFIAYPGS